MVSPQISILFHVLFFIHIKLNNQCMIYEHFQVKLNSLHKTVIKESPLVGIPKVERQLTQ